MAHAGTDIPRIEVSNAYPAQDTDPEPAYDQITELIAGICQAPMALISLIDGDRQWLKSVFGAGWTPTEPDHAFSTHAIERRGLLVVEDTAADARFDAHPLVHRGAGLRFYAGLPMFDAAGTVLGVLAVIDRVPRQLTALQQKALHAFADQVVALRGAHQRQRLLENALLANERAHAALRDSDERWRLLFARNPMPMWLFDARTLRFLAVNEAAVAHYGWSADEFADMTIEDIRPAEDLPALHADLARVNHDLRGGTAWRHRKKNGDFIHVDITAHSMAFEGREARLVMANDITEQVHATQALRVRDARWQRLFAASATGIASASLDGHFRSVNPAFCQLVGRPEAALLGAPMWAFTHADDVAACEHEFERLARGEIDVFTLDKRYLRPDGQTVWARASVTLTSRHRPGELEEERQYVAVVQDIDEQRRAREELQRQHELVALAGRLARLGGWQVLTGSELHVRWTDELRAILDIRHGDLPDVEGGLDMFRPGSRERMAAALQACLEDGNAFDLEVDLVTAAGKPLHVRSIGEPLRDPLGRVIGAQGALLDLTERHLAQQALRRSEERFRSVARATADAVWDWDLAEGTLWWNEGIQSLFGHDPVALGPGIESWSSLIHPDDREKVVAEVHAALAGSGTHWRAEYRFARADASHALVLDRGFIIRDEHGNGIRMVGGMTDLTAQREAEQRLRRQAALLDAARDAIVVLDLTHRVLYWNHGAERLFGWSAEQALGRNATEMLYEDSALAAQQFTEVLQHGECVALVRNRCRDGRAVTIDLRLSLLRDGAGQPEAVLAIKTDVTQRLALQAQLQQAQRLEAVGQLTGGVAHDFNNLLTVILGNTELLSEQLADNPSLLPLAQMAATAAGRGAELTQRLLAFARKQPLQPQAVDAHALLSGMDALLRRTLPEDIELQLVRAAGLWPLLADPVQLESAVLNLVLNARDAMPNGGKITLETANAWIDQEYAERHADVLPGQYTMLSVSDTGSGMNARTLARAFEPFFTTKGVGRGTGLGLSMVYGFAKQSHGHVKLYSEPGHGTTARLYLPRAEQAATVASAPPRPFSAELRGQATVLLVEDDDLVRRFASDVLRGLGYLVLVAEHGVAAMEILRTRSDDIDLLFTDVVMPGGINGRQLAEQARALRADLRVLFTSGYTENAIVHHGRLDAGVQLLIKPYRAIDLARKVRAMLDAQPPSP